MRAERLRPQDQSAPQDARSRTAPRGHDPRQPTSSKVHPVRQARATKTIEFKVYDTDWDSDAYLTVSGQNSNNSVRVTNAFMRGGR